MKTSNNKQNFSNRPTLDVSFRVAVTLTEWLQICIVKICMPGELAFSTVPLSKWTLCKSFQHQLNGNSSDTELVPELNVHARIKFGVLRRNTIRVR